MELTTTPLEGVLIFTPRQFKDDRGFFSETYNRRALEKFGINVEFVQDNHSLSIQPGIIRGLHYQIPPRAQAKLVRVVKGSIWDVVVDIRKQSPTFGQHFRVLLSADNWQQLYVPVGFAHGFVTREHDTEVIYKVTEYYDPASERGLLWCDPALAIDWGLLPEQAILSERDRHFPRLAEARELF